MDYPPSSPSTFPTSPGRLRNTSSFRHASAPSVSSQTSASPRTASSQDTPPKNQQPTRNVLCRPSSSAPKLNTRPEPSASVSPPLSPRPKPATLHHVLKTNTTQPRHNLETGNRTINSYEILGDIGSGVHGKVKKARDLESGKIVAIKIINRVTKKRLGNYDPNEQENKIKREIAIMKKCHHPNIVTLIDVIDNPNSQKVYLVLEYLERGEIKWRDKNNQPILTVDEIRPMIRDVVLGLEYLHFQGIIHRDIKPGNLLIANDGTVKITDFGVSHLAKMDERGNLLPENDLDLAKTAGSPAFFAPELCQFDFDKPRPPITKAIDVWALGITFYCLLFGREPFPGVYGEMELYDKISTIQIEPPEDQADRIDADAKDLLRRFLTKNPKERITLYQVRRHPFITKGISDPQKWAEETDLTRTSQPLEVTPQEVESAVTLFRNMFRRTLASVKMTARRSISYFRPRHSSGRVVSGVTSPVMPATAPSSPPANLLDAGARDSPFPSQSPKSDITDVRPKYQHVYFNSIANDITPPTPPDSGRVEATVPNGHVNGHQNAYRGDKLKSVAPPSPLTPPPVYGNKEFAHLNDDYSNLYYSDDDLVEIEDEHDDTDDEDRVEIKFGPRKKT